MAEIETKSMQLMENKYTNLTYHRHSDEACFWAAMSRRRRRARLGFWGRRGRTTEFVFCGAAKKVKGGNQKHYLKRKLILLNKFRFY